MAPATPMTAALAAALGLLLVAAAPGAFAAVDCNTYPTPDAYCKAMVNMAVATNEWDATCKTYLTCSNSAAVVRDCGPGTLWDSNLMTCNHADQVTCKPSCAGGAGGPCATNNGGCSADATCTNNNGQAQCACKAGFTGDGKTCSRAAGGDCPYASPEAYCQAMWVMAVAPNMWDPTCSTFLSCVNGAPVVRPCGPGTLWDDNLQTCNHADQVKCAPKCAGGAPNPCATNNGGCSKDATCSTFNGAAVCTCKLGFTGDGKTCTAPPPGVCETNNGGCSPDATCSEKAGKAVCTCKDGFMVSGKSCVPGCKLTGCVANSECQAPGACSETSGRCGAPKNKPDGTTCSEGSCKKGVCTGKSGWNGWFIIYKDITISFNWSLSIFSTWVSGSWLSLWAALPKNVDTVTLAFVTGECGQETWAGLSIQAVQANIKQLVAANKKYIISTGGANGKFTCGTAEGFALFMSRYYTANMIGLDFDIEVGQTKAEIDALIMRAKEAQKNFKKLKFIWTIPTFGAATSKSNLPSGGVGELVVQAVLKARLTSYYINLMVMYFGTPSASVCTLNAAGGCDMGLSAINAAKSLNIYWKVPFINIGLTPMIGRNDNEKNVFTMVDVKVLSQFVINYKLAAVSFWSLDRDTDCAAGPASPTCNGLGLNLGPFAFANAFFDFLFNTPAADPCAVANGGCSPDATCSVKAGKVACACKSGYTPIANGLICLASCKVTGCTADNECQDPGMCGATGKCGAPKNKPDGTACAAGAGSCKKGACSATPPADPCSKNNGGCSPNANCTNNVGAAVCKCNAGYSGDGKTCKKDTGAASLIFSPFKDITINFNWGTNVIGLDIDGTKTPLPAALPAEVKVVTLAFATGECGSESWGGVPVASVQATIAALVAAGKKYVISTGGAAGKFTCSSAAGFALFMTRYYTPNMVALDFDIEVGQTKAEINALIARAKEAQILYANLKFSWTIATFGAATIKSNLVAGGVAEITVNALKAAGLNNYYINLMVMYFGKPSADVCTLNNAGGCDMGLSAINAIKSLNIFFGISFANIGVTPMIGRNDFETSIFSMADLDVLTKYVLEVKLAGFHFWSLDRDNDCAAGPATPTCNNMGLSLGRFAFSKAYASKLASLIAA